MKPSSSSSPSSACLVIVLTLAAVIAPVAHATVFRTITGEGNSSVDPQRGAAGSALLRLHGNGYEDGVDTPRGGLGASSLPSARAVSSAIATQTASVPSPLGTSNWFWQWGQFLDHDLSITAIASPAQPFDIAVPVDDLSFDPTGSGTQTIALHRSVYDPASGTAPGNPREQLNGITAFIDASNLYGSDSTRAAALRSGVDGLMASTAALNGEVLLPLNTAGLPNAMTSSPDLFLSGDERANEQVGLTAAHTLFLREHNRLAGEIKQRLGSSDPGDAALVARRDDFLGSGQGTLDDFIYEAARKVVGAQMQVITYQEWLPLLLGDSAIAPFSGYDPTVDPGIANEFSTAAFRVGHTMLSPQLQRIDANGVDQGAVALRDAFFNPGLVKNDGVDSLLAGLAIQASQAVDVMLIDDVRNFLFGAPGMGGFDLAALNIQRGRDHGIASLNAVRGALGLPLHIDFDDLTGGDTALADAFASQYASVDDVDLWIGGLAETTVAGSAVGETFHAILVDQFTRLRDGDAFFYLNPVETLDLAVFAPDVFDTRLSDVILRNTSLTDIQGNVFLVEAASAVTAPPTWLLLLAGAALLLARRRHTATA